MPELGKKYTCYSCHTKFYDLGKPVPLCPKCGADQRDAEDTPVVTTSRSRRAVVVEEPAEEPEFAPEGEASTAEGDEDEEIAPVREEEADEDEEEEEEY
jgi:uncharacterized protein (TIGR02300 family)